MKPRIGIYSGTFDPIHSGHIAFAEHALRECKLDAVVILPEPLPRKKDSVTDIAHRIELVKRAVAKIPNLSVITTRSKQFTVKETLPELLTLFPNSDFTFLFGSDVIKDMIHQWHDIDVLTKGSSLAIGMRVEDSVDEIATIIKQLEKKYDQPIRYTCIKTAHTTVASSQIRQSLKDINNLDSGVNKYIQENNLYRS